MTDPYRQGPVAELKCPRCEEVLPPLDVAHCTKGCGAWVSMFAASEAFRAGETRENRLTRWWRMREPCPFCGEQMTLRGEAPALLQGCDVHGFFVDADTIEHTGLSRGDLAERLARKSDDKAALEAERNRIEQIAHERAREKEARELERLRTEQEAAEIAELKRVADHGTRMGEQAAAGNPWLLVRELMRLDTEVRRLAKRVDELERAPR